MPDEEERIKAEKLAAARKRVAQLQKQKKRAANKASTLQSDASKDADTSTKTVAIVPDESAPEATAAAHGQQAAEQLSPSTDPIDMDLKLELQVQREPAEDTPDVPRSPEQNFEEQRPTTTAESDLTRPTHGRHISLSSQSKIRSSSFRKGSVSQPTGSMSTSPSTTLKSPPLPPLIADGESVHEVFRKHVARIEELEKDNQRLEKELEETQARWRKTEDELEDLRESRVDLVELKEKLEKAERHVADVDALKDEIASLQRKNTHLSTRSHRNTSSFSVPETSEPPPTDLMQQLESKSATIEAMELEISNLRAQLSSSSGHQEQITALEEKLVHTESALARSQRELADAKHSLTRAAEKAVKEGVDRTSTETFIKTLQREIQQLTEEKLEANTRIVTLDKKLQALSNLHKESETRHLARLRESEKIEIEAALLRKKLASVENENLRLRDERERARKRDIVGGGDDEALDELEDEERARLERRIRELEGEIFDLRRGIWKEKRQELAGSEQDGPEAADSTANVFDDVDLVGGAPDHSRRRSLGHGGQRQQHSSFTTVLSSGLAAFTGNNSLYGNRSRAASNQSSTHPATKRGSLELLSEENLDDFDEAEFARAQAEEEARQRVEWVRDVKRKLKNWQGWRLDLVDSRAGAEGAGVGMGEIFEV